uniref:Uncharacterized protein MANES_17G084000 n=1 Tax=Rhizophora mucronata TaxID=61149 RepID=A0A2P2KNG9_RHIMU
MHGVLPLLREGSQGKVPKTTTIEHLNFKHPSEKEPWPKEVQLCYRNSPSLLIMSQLIIRVYQHYSVTLAFQLMLWHPIFIKDDASIKLDEPGN